MKSIQECVKIAQATCINMFGADFVSQHKPEFCSLRHEDKDRHLFDYTLLWAPFDDSKELKGLQIGGGRPFDYYASVIVNMMDGTVRIDPDPNKTKLPH